MSDNMILLLVGYGAIALVVFFGNLDSGNSSGTQLAATALFWPITVSFFVGKMLYQATMGLIDVLTGKVKP